MAFIDEAKIFVQSGDGGNGCVSFRREKFVPRGGPNGGDGGRGGDVVFQVDGNQHSLRDFHHQVHFRAERGQHGQGKDRHGRQGEGRLVRVPPGTLVKNAETGAVLADLVSPGQSYLAAKGGQGGLGNMHFASSTNRAPRRATAGEAGQACWLVLELKLLADVGLVGLPNAGKSTLLTRLTAARPKVADYPFTTLEPHLGVIQLPEESPCVVADIPGLIEGAHLGTGLGHKFLRHLERTRLLLVIIDASGQDDAPMLDHRVLEEELRQYKTELLTRRLLVVLNKCDLVSGERLAELRDAFHRLGIETMAISALNGTGLETLALLLVRRVMEMKAAAGGQDEREGGLAVDNLLASVDPSCTGMK
ncbi:MAG: GTPase ObgE [Desulfobulbaceae bacterium A2]|nr:MAG: GTPase ObgE [Desulfobulbaceae bacterium A2]